MTRAILVCWTQYHPRGLSQYYRSYFDFWVKQLPKLKDEFDFLYLLGQGWDFTEDDYKKVQSILGNKFYMITISGNHHWDNFKNTLPTVNQDIVLLLDQDTYIYKPGVIGNHFDQINRGEYDFISMFDGSGGLQPQVWAKFPFMKENNVTRLGPYYSMARKELFDGLNFEPRQYEPGVYLPELGYTTVEKDWADSFGEATFKIMAKNPKTLYVDQDRETLWFDGQGDHDKDSGIYHTRNWNLGVLLFNTKTKMPENYQYHFNITPKIEALRQLAWFWHINDAVGKLDETAKDGVCSIVSDYGVGHDQWISYLDKFKNFHGALR